MEEGNNLFDINKIILQISSVKRNKTLNVNYCVKQIQNMNLKLYMKDCKLKKNDVNKQHIFTKTCVS